MNVIENIVGIVVNNETANDAQGNFNFCGVMGSPVIDYYIGSYIFLQCFDDFKVASRPFSDY